MPVYPYLHYLHTNFLECLAATLSVTGGCFVPSTDPQIRTIGFCFWCCGNVSWLWFSKDKKVMAFMAMQVIYLGQNVIGIVNNSGLRVF